MRPEMHHMQPKMPCVTTNDTHHITTTRPLATPKAHQLALKELHLATNEFDYMVDLGIIRPSKSPRTSP